MSVQLENRRFSVTDYYRMVEAGILTDNDRVELIDGQVVLMSPMGGRHAHLVTWLTRAFSAVGDEAVVRVQLPLRLGEYQEPQPDLLLARPPLSMYRDEHPTAADVLLLVEVADSSLPLDRGWKLAMYAEAGIPEYWIVDVAAERVEVLREPEGQEYSRREQMSRGDTLNSLECPDLRISVADLFE